MIMTMITFLHLANISLLQSFFLLIVCISVILMWIIINQVRESIRINQPNSADEVVTENDKEEDLTMQVPSTSLCEEEVSVSF